MRKFALLVVLLVLPSVASAKPPETISVAAGTVKSTRIGITSEYLSPQLPCMRQVTSQQADPQVERSQDAQNVPLTGLSVSPPVFDFFEFPVDAGTYVCHLTLRNRRPTTTTYQLVPRGLRGSHTASSAAEYLDADDPRARQTAVSWIEPTTSTITLKSREVATVTIMLTIPSDVAAGSAYGGIDIVSRTKSGALGDDQPAVGIETVVNIPFLIRTGGSGIARARLRTRDLHAPRIRMNRDAWTIRGDLDNVGNLHATPTGRVRLRSLFGTTVTELPISGRPLLPGGRTRLAATWSGVPWFGLYRYDLRIGAVDDRTASPAQATGWFVALPPLWVLMLAGVVVLTIALRAVHRRRHASWDEPEDNLDY